MDLLRLKTMTSKMFPSEPGDRTCPRCGRRVTVESAIAVHVWADGEELLYDVVFTKNTHVKGLLMHMSADRKCDGEISGYIGKMLKKLGLSLDVDTSVLDSL
jgi:hypothetical protein